MSRRTSCRSRTINVQRPRISSVGSSKSGTIRVIIPAADADRTPLWESSRARQRAGSIPRCSAAFKNGSGAGLPLS
jgi:hypothetical protein